jgi:anhydro-N-acetylmuramic acid kinase
VKVIGLMSGTSMDGIDAAAVEIERTASANLAVTTLEYELTPYPRQLRDELARLAPSGSDDCVAWISGLNVAIGEAFARAAIALRERVPGISLIGSHGQTVFHEPRPQRTERMPSTLQLGEAAIVAQRTGITTIADFRVADVAAGGQGAPLVSFVDHALLRSAGQTRAVLNIGGIANLTLLPAGCEPADVRAFDCGPGNMLIDQAVRSLFPDGAGFDRDGAIAASGTVDAGLLAWLLSDPYFRAAAPKTAGREQFGPVFFARALQRGQEAGCSAADVVATLTELTARTIAAAVPADCELLVISGGGVHNATLVRGIAGNLAGRERAPRVARSDEFGIGVDAKEAVAFAVLAFEALHGRVNTLPAATGAREAVVAGKIVPGENYGRLMRSVWR